MQNQKLEIIGMELLSLSIEPLPCYKISVYSLIYGFLGPLNLQNLALAIAHLYIWRVWFASLFKNSWSVLHGAIQKPDLFTSSDGYYCIVYTGKYCPSFYFLLHLPVSSAGNFFFCFILEQDRIMLREFKTGLNSLHVWNGEKKSRWK